MSQARFKPNFLSTLGPNPTQKARPDLQLCGDHLSFFEIGVVRRWQRKSLSYRIYAKTSGHFRTFSDAYAEGKKLQVTLVMWIQSVLVNGNNEILNLETVNFKALTLPVRAQVQTSTDYGSPLL